MINTRKKLMDAIVGISGPIMNCQNKNVKMGRSFRGSYTLCFVSVLLSILSLTQLFGVINKGGNDLPPQMVDFVEIKKLTQNKSTLSSVSSLLVSDVNRQRPGTLSMNQDQATNEPFVFRKPNILFILADDLRPQLGIYGHGASTPSIDALGDSGIVFTKAHAQITVCNPSRASLLSGRRPDTTEIYGFEASTPSGWTTLPALFRRSGYTCFGVGKIFHWGPGPEDAWSKQVNQWRPSFEPNNSSNWETPSGRPPRIYAFENSLPQPSKTPPFHVGFWPDSNVFMKLKGTEQKALKSTVQEEPREVKVETELSDEDRSVLPFRDGIFASRAIRLMEVASAGDAPWFISIGFSLPHEPIRMPEWAWSDTEAVFETPKESVRPKGSPIFALGDIKERFVFRNGRRLNVQTHYGPKKPRVDSESASHKGDHLSETDRAHRREAYLQRVTASSKGARIGNVEVKGDDFFGTMPRTVWADWDNLIEERPLPLEARKELAHGYAAAVSFLDFQVGRVLRGLESLPDNADDNTLVVFTADHGFSLGEHGCFGKRTLWDQDTRVPLVVRPPPASIPFGLPLGTRHDGFVELIDLFPSLAEYAGLANAVSALVNEPPLDGSSFAQLLRPNRNSPHLPPKTKNKAFSQFPRCPVRINRKNERKCLLQEPWRTAGAGGFECQGRAADWTANHELALMGYSIRTSEWRYTAWVRVIGYSNQHEKQSNWQHNNLIVNWSFPPYFDELFDHRDGPTNGLIDFDENDNIAGHSPLVASALFSQLKLQFDLPKQLE